jgi:hypothetical protein
MPTEQHAEEILLESDDDLVTAPTEESFAKVVAQLVQAQKWKNISLGTRILDKRFLFVKNFKNGKTNTYWANLLYLDPQPQQNRKINWRWGISTLIFLAISVSLATVDYYFHISSKFVYFNSITILLATTAVLTFLVMIYTAKNELSFYTLNGRIPIVSLAFNKPTKEEFQAYVTTLKHCIERVQAQNAHKTKNRLANELAEHRRLNDEKIISDQDYEDAKNRILSQH